MRERRASEHDVVSLTPLGWIARHASPTMPHEAERAHDLHERHQFCCSRQSAVLGFGGRKRT